MADNVPGAIVSIHAPARGATFFRAEMKQGVVEFQSTPPHGERLRLDHADALPPQFQSTPPHGERLKKHCPLASLSRFNPRPRTGSDFANLASCQPLGVSIHAPARGATRGSSDWWGAKMFQSTPPHGERRGGCSWPGRA